jgi:hypothetical protein
MNILIHTFDYGHQIAVLSGQGGQIFDALSAKLKASFTLDLMEKNRHFDVNDLIDGMSQHNNIIILFYLL